MAFGFFGGALLYRLHRHSGGRSGHGWPAALLICGAFVAVQFLRVRLIAWPLVGVVLPLLVLAAARLDLHGWLGRLGNRAGSDALAIYLFGFPIMIGWRVLGAAAGIGPVFAGNPLGFALVLATIIAAAELWVWSAGRMTPQKHAVPRRSPAPAG
jgi:hypothetical protein